MFSCEKVKVITAGFLAETGPSTIGLDSEARFLLAMKGTEGFPLFSLLFKLEAVSFIETQWLAIKMIEYLLSEIVPHASPLILKEDP